MKTQKNKNYLISDLWNTSLIVEREDTKKRDFINASDLGSPFIDRFYKMKGIQPSNPYDERVLRVFAAGNEFHHLVYKVFEKIGVLQESEFYCEIPATDEILKVVGYGDAIIGGLSNWDEARERVKNYGFSEAIERISYKIIDRLEKDYSNGLDTTLIDVKSVNSNAFWNKKGYIGDGYRHHKLQIYTYIKALNLPKGILIYISKDDLTIEECPVLYPDESLEKEWLEDVKQMSYFYKNDITPPKEDDVIFDERKKKFEINWRVARSPYLTLITGLSKGDWEKQAKELLKIKNQELKLSKELDN